MKPDDPTVSCDETIYRYAPSIPHKNWTVTDQATQEVLITLAALSWGHPPDGISCYRETILHAHGLDWPDIKREPRNGVFSFVVADVRDCRLGAAFDPIPESERTHPRDAAHTLVVDCGLPKAESRTAREELAIRANIIHMGEPET